MPDVGEYEESDVGEYEVSDVGEYEAEDDDCCCSHRPHSFRMLTVTPSKSREN